VSARRFWRVVFTGVSGSGGAVGVSQLIMATTPGGAQAATGGTATASSVWSASWPISAAFDGNDATTWYSGSGTFLTTGLRSGVQFLQYEFATAVDIVEVRIRAPQDLQYSPESFAVLSSADGSTWEVRRGWRIDPVLTTGETRTFDATPLPSEQVGNRLFRSASVSPGVTFGVPPSVVRVHIGPAAVGARAFSLPLRVTPFSGARFIAGSTTSLGLPTRRRVDLIDQKSGVLVEIARTGDDGQFLFEQISQGPWTVLGVDETAEQNSVVYAHVIAAPMT